MAQVNKTKTGLFTIGAFIEPWKFDWIVREICTVEKFFRPNMRFQQFGLMSTRKSLFTNSPNNARYPILYSALMILGNDHCPFHYSHILLNYEYNQFTKHLHFPDKEQIMIVCFGDYAGGELVIETMDQAIETLDLQYRTVVLGSISCLYYFKPVTWGTKYTVIYAKDKK